MFYKQVATDGRRIFYSLIEFPHHIIALVSSKMTSASGQLVQRIRLYDEEEHPTQNNIMIDEDLLQYYQLLADRGDAQAQVKENQKFSILSFCLISMVLVNYIIYVIQHLIKHFIIFV
jgi:hypothetical protein